jgi:hypothetical protein
MTNYLRTENFSEKYTKFLIQNFCSAKSEKISDNIFGTGTFSKFYFLKFSSE